jgi:hypothetical protein
VREPAVDWGLEPALDVGFEPTFDPGFEPERVEPALELTCEAVLLPFNCFRLVAEAAETGRELGAFRVELALLLLLCVRKPLRLVGCKALGFVFVVRLARTGCEEGDEAAPAAVAGLDLFDEDLVPWV